MKCGFALWEKSPAGRLAQTGHGKCKCKWEFPVTEIPVAFFWGATNLPKPWGGKISRFKAFNRGVGICPTFQEIKA